MDIRRVENTRGVTALLLLALSLQTLHEVEHLAQVYQRWWLGAGPQQARGILFFLDVEWNHFLFNAAYLPLLAVVGYALLFSPAFDQVRHQRIGRVGIWCFMTGLAIQGYHVVEHTVRMGQFFQLGCTPCPGILGWYLDLVSLHFTLNTVTWLLPGVTAFALWRSVRAGTLHRLPERGRPTLSAVPGPDR